ncbi:MAG: hypothetical protein JXX29_10370 [Deltaproteobacteria bacterium]|nr:hypothetical protein [Deltaproteobacteria bacterium]MBN2672071.1 hypothetical protein [Deltaproteobacteria bacterium]
MGGSKSFNYMILLAVLILLGILLSRPSFTHFDNARVASSPFDSTEQLHLSASSEKSPSVQLHLNRSTVLP